MMTAYTDKESGRKGGEREGEGRREREERRGRRGSREAREDIYPFHGEEITISHRIPVFRVAGVELERCGDLIAEAFANEGIRIPLIYIDLTKINK